MRKLPEEKVVKLIELMNSTTLGQVPPEPEILDCFDLAMSEKTLDYLLAVGTGVHTKEQLKEIYQETFDDDGWEETWQEVFEMSFLMRRPDNETYILASIFPGLDRNERIGSLNGKAEGDP